MSYHATLLMAQMLELEKRTGYTLQELDGELFASAWEAIHANDIKAILNLTAQVSAMIGE